MRICICLLLLVALLVPSTALAEPSYYGRLTTVLETYDNVENETAVSAYQYLNLTVNEPFKLGKDNYFYFYGRLADDLDGKEERIDNRLYAAYLNVSEFLPKTDIRLGRQFISVTAGSVLSDGVEIRAKRLLDRVTLRLFAGGDVKNFDNYKVGDWLFGGSLDVEPFKNASFGVSYLQRYDRWDKTRQSVGFDAGYRFGTKARIYGEARYDVVTEMFDTYLLGGKLFIGKDLTTTVEYYYNVPVFDATNIYSVFAVDEYSEVAFRADYRLNKWFKLFGSYTYEYYENTTDSDVVEIGTSVSRYKSISLYASALYRDGWDDILGGKMNIRYHISDDFDIGAGIETDRYQRHDMPDSDTANRYFIDTTYYFSPDVYIYVKLEDLKSVHRDDELRARVRLTYAFKSKSKGGEN
jgi:hypothetical protein